MANQQINRKAAPLRLIKTIAQSAEFIDLSTGVATHDPAIRCTASLLSACDDAALIEEIVAAALPDHYEGNTRDELEEMISSAIKKGIGKRPRSLTPDIYEPGNEGPIAMGYTAEGHYALFDQQRKLVLVKGEENLMREGPLLGLASQEHWAGQFPNPNPKSRWLFDAKAVGEALITACRKRGGFDPNLVRGRGVYLDEDGQVVTNWGGKPPPNSKYVYVCFLGLREEGRPPETISADQVLCFLNQFNWAMPSSAMMVLGWITAGVICGALEWRPHIFVTGAKNTGKSTILDTLAALASPIAMALDGQSTEAGIRQTIGADSRPVILDEFESDLNTKSKKPIIKLARSASSGTMPVARGTPEGKSLHYNLRCTFCFGAINPIAITSADQSRIVIVALEKHDSDPKRAAEIRTLKAELASSAPAWCDLVIGLAKEILDSIPIVEAAMPAIDGRHAKNMAILLGSAWVVLNERTITPEDAEKLVDTYAGTISVLAEPHEADDSYQCLSTLLEYELREDTVERLLRAAATNETIQGRDGVAIIKTAARQALERQGMRVLKRTVLIPNSHRGMAEAFRGTLWESGTWGTSLARLPGAKKCSQKRFSGQTRSLCIELDIATILKRDE